MPRGMEVFDADEHIGYKGSAKGDSTGLSKKAGSQSNSGTQKYDGHANGPKKVKQLPSGAKSKYYLYDAKRAFKHDKLQLEDLADDEDFTTTDENVKNLRVPRGGKKGK